MQRLVSFSMMLEWYAIATAGRREKTASAALQAQGIETLAPLYRERLETRLRVTQLFPGYILAKEYLPHLRELLSIWRQSHFASAVGIHHLVGICDRPHSIEPEFIEELIQHIDANGFFVVKPPRTTVTYPEIATDTEVVITKGPYAGLFAKFSHMRGAERSIVLTRMFDRDCPIEVARADIEVPSELEAITSESNQKT